MAEHMDTFKARARSVAEGLEPELSVAVDVMFPMQALTRAAAHSGTAFPHTPLRLYVEVLGGVVQPVLDGTCRLGVVGSLPELPDELDTEPLQPVPFVTVVAPSHAMAAVRGAVPAKVLVKQVQLVLTDRTPLTSGRDFAVQSPLTWRLADLGAKHAFLRAGLGWGHMPLHIVEDDLAAGRLKRLRLAEADPRYAQMPMRAVWRKDTPPGPAGRAFVEQLRDGVR